jgi:MscS family membrane protein
MPTVLRPRTMGLERWQWLGLIILFLIGLAAWQVVRFIASHALGRLLRRRFSSIGDQNLARLYSPICLLASVITYRLGLRALDLTQGSLTTLRNAMFILTAIALIWFTYRLVDVVIVKLRQRALGTESQADDLLVPFVGAIARFAIVVIGLILVAENLDFNVTGLIAGLGIGGIAIALASQETLSNFFGSLVLLIEQPFKAEDRVEVDGVKGTVKEVGFRSTRILTFDDSLVTVPNSTIAKGNIINDGIRRHRRWVVKLSVPYKNGAAKVEQLCSGIEKIIETTDALKTEAYRLHLFDLAPPSIVVRVEVNFKEDAYEFELAARHQFILDVLKLADKLEVDLEVGN